MQQMSPSHRRRMRDRRDQLIAGLLRAGGVEVTVTEPVVAETVSVRFDGVRGDTLADALDLRGICVSTGSACHTRDDAVSHVLTAQGLSAEAARATVRFSLGSGISADDIDRVVTATVRSVERLRRIAGARGVDR